MASTAAVARSLGYAEARERVLGAVSPLAAETVPLLEARGRALARPVRAAHSLPPFRNSSMDGFAVRARDLDSARREAPVELPVSLVIPAGFVASRALGAGEAMRIMTGAMLPEGADAIVPFEEAERLAAGGVERARFATPTVPGAHVRAAGADVAAGAETLASGRELSPHDLALLAALGVPWVQVGSRPRVAVISTGDELLAVDEPLRPGAIRDSNLPLLASLLEECGCRVVRALRVPDDPDLVGREIVAALESADAVLSIGGVSAGDFDPVKQCLAGAVPAELWRVAMKPGRPQAFGCTNGRMFYGLPGNPASVACVFEALVRPALRKMQGFAELDRPALPVRAETAIDSRAGRTDFVRVTLASRDGAWWASPAGEQVSGHLLPQSLAHALLVVPETAALLSPGDSARALLLRWPGAPAA